MNGSAGFDSLRDPTGLFVCRPRHWMSVNHKQLGGYEDEDEKTTYSASRMVVEIPINSDRMSGALLVFS